MRLRDVAVSAVLALALSFGVAGLSGSVPDSLVSPESALPAHIAAERVALELAAESGVPVAVDELTTEFQSVVANPDGTLSLQVHLGQTRVKDDAGEWVDVDFTLQRRDDGTVAPVAHPRDLLLSGGSAGGVADLARITVAGHALALGWRGPLPEPVLDGHKATYVEVLPGVDIVLEVRRTGFAQFFVIKTAEAAALAGTVRMPWRAPGLTARADGDGGTEFVDAAGEQVARLPAGRVWDAAVSAQSGEPVNVAPVDIEVSQTAPMSGKQAAMLGASAVQAVGADEVVVAADAQFLSRDDLAFPITIDPVFSGSYQDPNYDAFVQNTWSSDASGESILKLGKATNEDGTYYARSFLSFHGMNNFNGAVVTSAVLRLWMYHSWSCTKATWQAWQTGYVTTTARWTKQPAWVKKMAETNFTVGHPNCLADAWAEIGVKDTFQNAFDSSTTNTANIGLRAKDETTTSSWKKFHSREGTNDPYVSLTYTRKPNAPTNVYVGNKSCPSSGTTVFSDVAGSSQPLKANVSDPDASGNVEQAKLYTYFYVRAKGGTWPGSASASAQMVTQAKGGSAVTATASLPSSFGLVEHQDYEMRVRAKDQYGVYGAYSYTCTFRLDNGYPTNPPSITHVDNPAIYAPGVPGGGPGVSGRFTLAGPTGDADVHKYRYRMISVKGTTNWTEVSAATPGDAVTIALTPPFDDGTSPTSTLDEINQGGQWTIEAEYADGNNRWSPTVAYEALVDVRPPATSVWHMDEADSSNVLADPAGAHTANLFGGMSKTSGFGDGGTGWHFNGTDGVARVSPAPIDTMRAFSVAGWVKLDTAGSTDQSVAVKNSEFSPSFALQYETDCGCWEFQMRTGSTSGIWKIATSTTPARAGVWTHLAGTYDPMGGVLSLYVNGRLEATAAGMVAFDDPQGSLTLGNADYGDPLAGVLDEVSVWQRVLDPREVAAMAVYETAAWHLDHDGRDTTGSTAPHDLSAFDGATNLGAPDPASIVWWGGGRTESGDGRSLISGAGAVELGGQRWLGTDGPVIDTRQSFSVSAWVRAEQASGYQAVFGQDGVVNSGTYLRYQDNYTGGAWVFAMRTSDDSGGTQAAAWTSGDVQFGQWTHLVGVYDAAAGKMFLYVDGALAATADYQHSWQADGPLSIGRVKYLSAYESFWQGGIDEVRVYTGMLDAEMVDRLYRTQDGVL